MPVEILLAQRAIADTAEARAAVARPPGGEFTVPPEAGEEPAPTYRHRSAGRAALYNLILPGAGHIYYGKKRGWIHLGLEGAAWVAYLYYRDRGTSKEDEFQDYADGHWDYARWKTEAQGAGDYTVESDELILRFLRENRQHYYEDIGKLEQYRHGWDDWSSSIDPDPSLNRSIYTGLRAQSNSLLRNSRYALVGGFVNRIVSAVDMLRYMKRNGAPIGADTQLHFRMHTKPFSSDNGIGVEIRRRL